MNLTNVIISIVLPALNTTIDSLSLPSRPVAESDVMKVVIGSPRAFDDLYFVLRNNREFWIHNGNVSQFWSPLSYFSGQDISQLSSLVGVEAIPSEKVEAFCRERLAGRACNPLAQQGLVFQTQNSDNPDIPFSLLKLEGAGRDLRFECEVDRRIPQIVSFSFGCSSNVAGPLKSAITNALYAVGIPKKTIAVPREIPRKQLDDQTAALIKDRLVQFAPRLNDLANLMSSAEDVEFSLDELDLDRCRHFDSDRGPLGLENCVLIYLKNGAKAWVSPDSVISITFPDSIFAKPSDEWTDSDRQKLLRDCGDDWKSIVLERGARVASAFCGTPELIDWSTAYQAFMGGEPWSRYLIGVFPREVEAGLASGREALLMEVDLCSSSIRCFDVRSVKFLRQGR